MPHCSECSFHPCFMGLKKKNLQLFLARVEKCVLESLNSSSSCGSGKHGQLRRICSQGPASPVSANVHVQARRRPSYARVRARGTDIGFSNKPRYCFLFSFLSFFPSFSLLAISGSFLWVVHNSPAALAADEIRVQKKRVVSDAPEAWIWGLFFYGFLLGLLLENPADTHRTGEMHTLMEIDIQRHKNVI